MSVVVAKFKVQFDGSVEMTVDEVWPDGDAPENPTAKDVAIKMRRTGTVASLLSEWNLDSYLDVYVDDEVLRLVAP